ncbi:peptide-methionine (S)-S-oxide reductase, partial [Salmonella enterica subsp. enterica serovar Kentucky]|nr:peptide-methionine (S)-S-oxide reductase [Salmonella enterica subsp. enterica serovar Kentucky]
VAAHLGLAVTITGIAFSQNYSVERDVRMRAGDSVTIHDYRFTGHTEAVRIVYDPAVIRYEQLLQTFWENHDPTQGMQQGNDHG